MSSGRIEEPPGPGPRWVDASEPPRYLEEESDVNLAQYWSLVVRGRKIIAACIAIAVVVAIIVSLMSRPLYLARTTLKVDPSARLRSTSGPRRTSTFGIRGSCLPRSS
jgi:uncharacterized protein involved in exopolysaccharide biosynthesis